MATRLAFAPGALRCPRNERGKLITLDAFGRFREKCRFDARTGCVVWVGGTTSGRGNSAVYGAFWYEGRRWFAHRWAAIFVHDLDVGTDTVGHWCPHTPDRHPNTLCVEHVKVQTLSDNVAEGNRRRVLRAQQALAEKQNWLLVGRGYEPAPPVHDPASFGIDHIPFFTPPAWLGDTGEYRGANCPF